MCLCPTAASRYIYVYFIHIAIFNFQIYYNLPQYIIINGPLVIQAYLVMSGLLLTYKIQIYSENHDVNWSVVPKGILLRYLRYVYLFKFGCFWVHLIRKYQAPLWASRPAPARWIHGIFNSILSKMNLRFAWNGRGFESYIIFIHFLFWFHVVRHLKGQHTILQLHALSLAG